MAIEFVDKFGDMRRLGCIPQDTNVVIPVGAAIDDVSQQWAEATCRAVLSAPGRVSRIQQMRQFIFPDGKYAGRSFLDVFTAKANQGPTSGCNGGSVANNKTLARFFAGIHDGTVYSGSYSYSWMNHGQDNGSTLADGYQEACLHGYVSVDLCPWSMIYRKQTAQFDALAAQDLAVGPWPVRTQLGFLNNAAKGHLQTVAIEAGPQIDRVGPDGMAARSDSGMGNHAVTQMDAEILPSGDIGYWLYLDWGPKHANNGFVCVTWDSHLAQTYQRHQFWCLPVGQP